MSVTGDTVTDEQILELRDASVGDSVTIDWCNRALGAPIYEGQSWHQPHPTDVYKRCSYSRGVCAQLINERAREAAS